MKIKFGVGWIIGEFAFILVGLIGAAKILKLHANIDIKESVQNRGKRNEFFGSLGLYLLS